MKAYKVVTIDMKSLGLRKNPNIMTFPIGQWCELKDNEIEEGVGDWGGIWVAASLSGARGLSRYMMKKYGRKTRIFETEIGKELYRNSYRVKTDKIKIGKEIT